MNGRIVALDVKLEEVENSSRVKVKAGNALEAEVSNLEEQLSAKAQKRMLAAKAAKMTPPNTKLEGEILPDSELEEEPLPTTELVGDTPPDTRLEEENPHDTKLEGEIPPDSEGEDLPDIELEGETPPETKMETKMETKEALIAKGAPNAKEAAPSSQVEGREEQKAVHINHAVQMASAP